MSFWSEQLIRSWGFAACFQQDEIRVGYSCSLCTLSTPPQREVLFPLSSTSLQSSQTLSPSVFPTFRPSFSSQTSSCKPKWKASCFIRSWLPRKHLHALLIFFPGLSAWDSGSCCMEQLLPLLSHFMSIGFSELCVLSSMIVPLHNRHVESYFSSRVHIPAARPCDTPVVLSSLRVPKDLAACDSLPVHSLLL